jgi:hypothetical protein
MSLGCVCERCRLEVDWRWFDTAWRGVRHSVIGSMATPAEV